jgi:pyruvate ferredoxin oxidoreductase delta subunit
MKPKGWKELTEAGIITDAGNAKTYNTGSWRSKRPVRDDAKCINCLICWAFCPDSSILVEDGKVTGIDLEHCKGCGICAKECPKDVIAMVSEDDIEDKK